LPLCAVGEGDGDGGLGEAQEGLHIAPLHVSMVTDICGVVPEPRQKRHKNKNAQKSVCSVSIE
jgi:hypothetical protein